MENELPHHVEVVDTETVGRNWKMPKPKTMFIVCGIIILAALLFLFKGRFVVAMVNGHFISRSSLTKQMESQIGQQTLDSLVINSLVENKVKDINLTKAEVDDEIKKTEDQLTAQGTTLKDALASRNLSDSEFRKRITTQLKLERLLADKTTVTDDEVTKYIAANRASLPKVDQATLKAQVADNLKQDKFNKEVSILIDQMKADAKIRYFVKF